MKNLIFLILISCAFSGQNPPLGWYAKSLGSSNAATSAAISDSLAAAHSWLAKAPTGPSANTTGLRFLYNTGGSDPDNATPGSVWIDNAGVLHYRTTEFDGSFINTNTGDNAENAWVTANFLPLTGGTLTGFTAFTTTGSLGQNVTTGQYLYFKPADGKWYKTDADAQATCIGAMGFALEDGSTDETISIQYDGSYTESNRFTLGVPYYVSASAGDLTETKPSTSGQFVVPACVALTVSTCHMKAEWFGGVQVP